MTAHVVDVGPAADIEEGATASVSAGGIELALVRWNGEIFAVRDRCPHQGGQLCKGPARALLRGGEPGRPSLEVERGIVVCPWHRWEWDLRTGAGVRKPRLRLRTYPVEVVGGRVLVYLGLAGGRPDTSR